MVLLGERHMITIARSTSTRHEVDPAHNIHTINTPIRGHAFSLALDTVQIRIDNSAPDGRRYRRLMRQKWALERLARVPRSFADDARGVA